MTTSESRGSSTVTSLRLCSRAPETTMEFWRTGHKTASHSTAAADGLLEQTFASERRNAHGRGQQARRRASLASQVARGTARPAAPRRSRAAAARAGRTCGRGGGCCSRSHSRSGAKSPASMLLVDVAAGRPRSALPQLGGHQVPDRVRREVADQSRRPSGCPAGRPRRAVGTSRPSSRCVASSQAAGQRRRPPASPRSARARARSAG